MVWSYCYERFWSSLSLGIFWFFNLLGFRFDLFSHFLSLCYLIVMKMLKELTQELTKDFIDNVDQLDSEERHKAYGQRMFLSEIEEKFR